MAWCIILPFILVLFASPCIPPLAGVASRSLWVHVSSDASWPDRIITQFQLHCARVHFALLKPRPPQRCPIGGQIKKCTGWGAVIYFTWFTVRMCVCVCVRWWGFTITLMDRWHNLLMDTLRPNLDVDYYDLLLSVCVFYRERVYVSVCWCVGQALHLSIREWWGVESIRHVISGAVHLSIWAREILRGRSGVWIPPPHPEGWEWGCLSCLPL